MSRIFIYDCFHHRKRIHLPSGSSTWMNYGLMEIFQFFHFFFFYVGFNILKWKEFAWLFGFSIEMYVLRCIFDLGEIYMYIFFFLLFVRTVERIRSGSLGPRNS